MNTKKRRKWTPETIAKEALNYSSRLAFQKGSESAYNKARKLGILGEVCAHMHILYSNWTVENVRTEALNWDSRGAFKKGSPTAYRKAICLGILGSVCSHMAYRQRPRWSDEEIQAEALKYSSRAAFQNNSLAYYPAFKRGLVDKVCSHMEYMKYQWSPELLRAEALKYDTLKEFRTGSPEAFYTANATGIYREITRHLTHGKSGFDTKKPAILYYIRFDRKNNHPVYKIGITNVGVSSRLFTMKPEKQVRITIINEKHFKNGADAIEQEKKYHTDFNVFRYQGEDFLANGRTELYTFDVLGLDSQTPSPELRRQYEISRLI